MQIGFLVRHRGQGPGGVFLFWLRDRSAPSPEDSLSSPADGPNPASRVRFAEHGNMMNARSVAFHGPEGYLGPPRNPSRAAALAVR